MKNVTKVPHFVVCEDPDTIDGESWTIQCEVLQHKPQGMAPPQEDPIPNLNLELGPLFEFFGLGQPVLQPENQGNQDQGQHVQAWDQWSVEMQTQQQQMQEAHHNAGLPNLNEEPQGEQVVELDLNQPLLDQDLNLVIINYHSLLKWEKGVCLLMTPWDSMSRFSTCYSMMVKCFS